MFLNNTIKFLRNSTNGKELFPPLWGRGTFSSNILFLNALRTRKYIAVSYDSQTSFIFMSHFLSRMLRRDKLGYKLSKDAIFGIRSCFTAGVTYLLYLQKTSRHLCQTFLSNKHFYCRKTFKK